VRIDDFEDPARKENKRVVVGAVAREIADRRTHLVPLFRGHALAEIERIRDPEAEQPAIEILAALGIGDVHAEVAEAPDAERPRQLYSADGEFLCRGLRDAFGLVHIGLSLAGRLYARLTHRESPTRRVGFTRY